MPELMALLLPFPLPHTWRARRSTTAHCRNRSRDGHPASIKWLSEPEEHDYPAAQSYLNLLFEEAVSGRYVGRLKAAKMTSFKAKDIFRASGLSLLGISNSHVEKDGGKIDAGKSLSPLLLVRDP